MKSIKEYKDGSNYYIVTTKVGDKTINQFRVNIRLATVNIEGDIFYILYASDGSIIEDAYIYLNHRLDRKSENTRNSDAYALKELFAFCEVFDLDYKNLNRNDVIRLGYFLKGIRSNDKLMEVNRLKNRSVESVNLMFGKYRMFMKEFEYNVSQFENHNPGRTIEKSTLKPFRGGRDDKQPAYTTQDEYIKIIRWIRNNINDEEKRLRAECIVRLMFERGLRIGEVLGLTLEDIKNDGNACFLVIRNRKSDKRFQKAKTLMNIYSCESYKSKEYAKENIGRATVGISQTLYESINNYIDIAHVRAQKKHKKRYMLNKADSVESVNDDNFYIFLNSCGSSLSQQSWNMEMRWILENNGIKIDYLIKRNGLNHKLRHGCVMTLKYDYNLRDEETIKITRHSSVLGLAPYDTPSDSQILKIYEEIEKEILGEDNI